jgi:translation initiation factor IF-1
VEVQCENSAFGHRQRRMLTVVRRMGKHYSWHLQGDYVLVVANPADAKRTVCRHVKQLSTFDAIYM